MASVLVREDRGWLETWRHRQWKESHVRTEAEIRVNVSISQGMPRFASSHQKLGNRHGIGSPPELLEKPTLLTS